MYDYSLGFDTAVNTAVDAITKIRDTASSHGRNNVVEVMGRDTGHLALAAGIAGGAEYILIPEKPFDIQEICEGIERGYASGKTHCIIVVAEGVGGYFGPDMSLYDSIGFQIGQQVRKRTGLETRVTVLGHIQRGGTPTVKDRLLGTMFGSRAVEALIHGDTSKIVGLSGNRLCLFDIEEVVGKKKPLDEEMPCSYFALRDVKNRSISVLMPRSVIEESDRGGQGVRRTKIVCTLGPSQISRSPGRHDKGRYGRGSHQHVPWHT